jgi:hypothetical protein
MRMDNLVIFYMLSYLLFPQIFVSFTYTYIVLCPV